MNLKKDERLQSVKCIAIRYTYCFQILVIVALLIISIMYKDLVLLPPLYLLGSPIYISVSLNSDIGIIVSTQLLVLFATQAIYNKRLGGTLKPIVSGTAGFRRMDERERIVSDKAVFITYIYANIFLVAWAIIDIFTSRKLGLSLMIVILQLIFYSIAKVMLLDHYGEGI